MQKLANRIHAFRSRKGLSCSELAAKIGVSRQMIYDMEKRQVAPNTAIAIRLATALDARVEDLFLADAPPAASPLAPLFESERGDARVLCARIGERSFAIPLRHAGDARDGFIGADAVLDRASGGYDLLASPDSIGSTAILMGCDPSLGILAAHVARRGAPGRLLWLQASSRAALALLKDGKAHIAGAHLSDPSKKDLNVEEAGKAFRRKGGLLVAYAHWEQGLVVAKGNPKGIARVEDLARRDLRFVNREAGSGARLMLDRLLKEAAIPSTAIRGYSALAASHMESGRCVQCGGADAGLGLRAVAEALDLAFVPLAEIRFDLAIPREHLSHPAVRAMLDAMQSAPFRRELSALAGYSTRATGEAVADLAAA